ncbi:recombinase family protein [Vibrio crassostreae]|uniref:recombinase family protein n=1 Tax=Vibrio crassostreae TaxID=246167 RepID=UPI0003048193|nr:recombinase family protein [Vibrio crassostreae]OED91247.1 hypothetical protein A141_12345 [Vibrio crassostreae ZF-91]
MVTAYSYVRFSTPDQAYGDSETRQLKLAIKYCKDNNLTLSDRTFKDLGISGYSGKVRPSLFEMFDCIESGEIKRGDYLLIETFDRLSRRGFDDTHQLIRQIVKAGVIVVSVQDNLVINEESLNDSMTIVRLAISADLAHKESLRKSVRISESKTSLKQKLLEGQKVTISSNVPFWLNIENGVPTADEQQVELVNMIYDLSLDGNGFTKILNVLNSSGIKAPKGGQWGKSTLAKLLSNRAVLGEYQPYKSQSNGSRAIDPDYGVIHGYYPQIITEDKFIQVQVAKNKRKTYQSGNKGKEGLFPNLFQQFAKCSTCESSLEIVNKGKTPKGGKYLVCSSAKRKGSCKKNKHFRYSELEKILNSLVMKGVISLESDKAQSKKAVELSKLEHELIKAKQKFEKFLMLDLGDDMDLVRRSSNHHKKVIAGLEKAISNLNYEVHDGISNASFNEAGNLLKLNNNTAENATLRSRFNLALIKKYGICSIGTVGSYTFVEFKNSEDIIFISPNYKWYFPSAYQFTPLPIMVGVKSRLRISQTELKRQAETLLDCISQTNIEGLTLHSNTLKETISNIK